MITYSGQQAPPPQMPYGMNGMGMNMGGMPMGGYNGSQGF